MISEKNIVLDIKISKCLTVEIHSSENDSVRKTNISVNFDRNYNRSVMKTVKAVNKRSFNSFGPGYSEEFTSARVSPSSSVMSIPGTPYSELYEGDNDTDSMAG